ncbi:hypothetical protein H4R19_004793 [Coemansia spiralis]|nr:hypothetical protein H4R19_004793 [Coemansia spiralis]
MADKHPEHLLSSAPDPNRPAASPSPSAAHASLSRTVPAAVHSRPSDPDRRPSASSTSDMQVDHDAQYSVDAASPAMALGLGLVGAPVHPSPDTAAGATHSDDSHATGDGAHRQLAARRSLPEDARSGSLPPRSTAPALQTTPVHSRQSAEDIHMSESPDLAAGGRGFHRPLDLGSESASPHPSAQHDDEDDEDEDDEDADDDADGSKKHDGVSMPAKSALLYHAGYNSGRGAVWRFFRVVEARVSGNTDRAECLLCNKRMLGKSADMKKHIVHNCPSRNEISEDMLPILAIVKAELENPKKRAKRNSTTPLTLQIDGSFGPVTPTYAPARADHAPPATRAYPGPVRKTPPPPRTPTHPHGSPYDLQQHHRTKITKYPR